MKEAQKIIESLGKGDVRPVYLLQGDEPYYIDQITDYFETQLLDESEKSFNFHLFYGQELDATSLIERLRSFPMMGQRQVIILKEAQQMRTFKGLEPYFENPVASTVFVINYKGKKIAKNTKIYKHIAKHGVVFNSQKLYENQVPGWIGQYVAEKGLEISPKATALLLEYLGTDLSKIINSLEKLTINKEGASIISEEEIEAQVGISKDYNVFELGNALLSRDVARAFRIISYFKANPKAGPMPVITASFYMLYSKLLLWHRYRPSGSSDMVKLLKISPYYTNDYKRGASNYNESQVRKAIELIAAYDLKSKGVDVAENNDGALLQELTYKILNV